MNNDLFGLSVDVTPSSFSAIYCSGASAYWDARGVMEAGYAMGVVATDLPLSTVGLIKSYAEAGGKTFIDSGAFGAFVRGQSVDFESVFMAYEQVLQGLSSRARSCIAIVMPDVVGDQAASVDVLLRYQARVEQFIKSGADCIIPIQRGEKPVEVVGDQILAIFGKQVRFGIPSNAAALADEELAKLRHSRFHILGKASMDSKLRRRAYTLLEGNPGADLTCDANLIRSRLGEVTREHRALIDSVEHPFAEVFDDTELVIEVLDGRNWLRSSEVKRMASMLGESDALSAQRWVKAHRETGLRGLVEEIDPEGSMLWHLLPSLFNDTARTALSARLRATAVAKALAA